MEDAKSMYHGGELVSALDCDFESYRELGLLCPFCNEPVYLCGETVRQSSRTHKLSYIRPHFKHFPGGDPLDFDCEKRAISAEGKRYLDAIRAERRGQRLELFNRYFLEMYCWNWSKPRWYPSDPPSQKTGVQAFNEHVKSVNKSIKVKATWIHAFKKYFILRYLLFHGQASNFAIRIQSALKKKELGEYVPVFLDQMFDAEMLGAMSKIDFRLHEMIVMELIEWLVSRSSNMAWAKLIYIFHLNSIKSFGLAVDAGLKPSVDMDYKDLDRSTLASILDEPKLDGYVEPLLAKIVNRLACIPWQQQIEEKSKLLRAKAR